MQVVPVKYIDDRHSQACVFVLYIWLPKQVTVITLVVFVLVLGFGVVVVLVVVTVVVLVVTLVLGVVV